MKQKAGFTLAELSVVLMIIAAIVGMTVASGVSAISSARLVATNNKMAAINQALMAFRVAYDRLPCPSDLSQVQGNATYGTEGACTAIAGGVFVAQNAAATATAAEGGIPAVALGLPNDFMYDGWGNRFRYAVDTGMTTIGSFSGSHIGCVNGAITITTGGIVAYPAAITLSSGAVYALISHGANGHGAVSKNAVVNNAGSLNTDELTNCHCTSTGAAGTYAPTYVQEAPYTYKAIAQANSNYNFDDIVTYRERWQMQANWDKAGTGCSNGVYSRTITIDHTKVGTVNNTDQVNFPLLFSGTYAYLATAAHGGNVTNANGYDITFTSDAAGKIVLPFERESYNATTGAVTFWVQVPTVSHTADTVIYLQYDNAGITTDQSNKTGTWDSYYAGVWHLDETSGTQYDSTTNANNLTTVSVATQGSNTANIANGADVFTAGSGQVAQTAGGAASLLPTNITLEAWVKIASWPTVGNWSATVVKKNNSSGPNWNSYALQFDNPQNVEFSWWNSSNTGFTANGTTVLSTGTWYLFAGQYNSSTNAITVSLNGAANSGAGTTTTGTMQQTNSNLLVGDSNNTYTPGATIGEVRMSNTVRSADWLKTEYNNQNSPGTFYTVGAAVSR